MCELVSLDYPLYTHYGVYYTVNPKRCVGLNMIAKRKSIALSQIKKGIIAKPAFASPIDTIKCQPDIFSNLVMMSTGDSTNQNYSSSINGQ
jgi:hypothetical protein